MRDEVPIRDRPIRNNGRPDRERMTEPCCPVFVEDKTTDSLDFHYRLLYPTRTRGGLVEVEVIIHARLRRWTVGLAKGDLVYSTTLLPGERVRLFTQDRRSRFTWDAESSLSYRHEQTAEERYYMSALSESMRDLTSRDEARSSSTGRTSYDTHGETSGALETFFLGPSVEVGGSHNSSSVSEFMRELHYHAEASHRCATLLHLSNIAIRCGRKIRYDPVKEEIIGDEEANRLVYQPLRAPWRL